MNPPSSILWIARMRFLDYLRIREVELARGVSRRARVVALDRSETTGWDEPMISSKLRVRWDMALGGWGRWTSDGVERFRMPVVVATGPITNRIAAWINERRVRQAIDRFGCGTVFHSNPFLFLPPPPGHRSYRVHFDLVDNFFDGWPDTLTGLSRKRFMRDAMLRADSLSAISHCLCDRVEEFIGRRPDLAMLLIGPGSERVPRARDLGAAQGIHVVGPVPTNQIWDYFHAADLGLLAFILEPGTHHSLPLKVLEFGAAGKPMLATPLHELKRLNLPHVRFAPYDSEAWRDALLDEATYTKPDPAILAAALSSFSWDAATEELLKVMGLS